MRALLDSTRTSFTSRTYLEKAVLFHQGDHASNVTFIERGTVRLGVSSSSGKEVICGVLTSGAFLGEGVLRGDTATFPVPDGLDLGEFPVVDISVEPFDGDPSHSGDSVVRGTLTDA